MLPGWWRALRRRRFPVFFHRAYRPPVSGLEGLLDPRRAELVLGFLLDRREIARSWVRTPSPLDYETLGLVHGADYLESLHDAEVLARIFGVEPSDVPVDELLYMVRLACGGTLGAARAALEHGGPALNLLGGFHHASPGRGGGMCAVNDLAVAVAVLRREGFAGRVGVLDLDAHPPDGTADCLRDDPNVWMGSLSASNWGPLRGVDEVVLPEGSDDGHYLEALAGLLARMGPVELAFVVAGGDVLAQDKLGRLGLSLDGARHRDLLVAQRLGRVPAVWLPGGGYRPDSWQVLAGTAMVLSRRTPERVPPGFDPLRERFLRVARTLAFDELTASAELSEEDVAEALGFAPRRKVLLGFYTAEGVEYALSRFGILAHLRRLGYAAFRVEIDVGQGGDRFRLYGSAQGAEHLLVEAVLEVRTVTGRRLLFVNWLSLRDPRARFGPARPRLPGQEVPGLGLAREAAEVLALLARRLGLEGVAFRPAWFHTAYAARDRYQFVDPRRQGRFEAMLRDLKGVPLLEVTSAVAEGRVQCNERPYVWEATDMVRLLEGEALGGQEALVVSERQQSHFSTLPTPAAAEPG